MMCVYCIIVYVYINTHTHTHTYSCIVFVLTWIRYFTLKMFACSPQEKTIAEFIKMTRSNVYTPLILNTVVIWMIHSCGFFSVIVVHESLLYPEQLNCLLFFRKILQLTLTLWFSSIFVYLNPFQQWLYDWDASFHTEDDWGTHIQLLQKIQTLTDAPEGETTH